MAEADYKIQDLANNPQPNTESSESIDYSDLIDHFMNVNFDSDPLKFTEILEALSQHSEHGNFFDLVNIPHSQVLVKLIDTCIQNEPPVFDYALITVLNIANNIQDNDLPIPDEISNLDLIQKLFQVYIITDNNDEIELITKFITVYNKLSPEHRDMTLDIFDLEQLASFNEDNFKSTQFYIFLTSLLYYPLDDKLLSFIIELATSDVLFLNASAFNALLDLVIAIAKQNINVILETPAFLQIIMQMENFSVDCANGIIDFFQTIVDSKAFVVDPPHVLIKFIRSQNIEIVTRAVSLICCHLRECPSSIIIFSHYGVISAIVDSIADANFARKEQCTILLYECLKTGNSDFILKLLSQNSYHGNCSAIELMVDILECNSKETFEMIVESFIIIFNSTIPEEEKEKAKQLFYENGGADSLSDIDEEILEKSETLGPKLEMLKSLIATEEEQH